MSDFLGVDADTYSGVALAGLAIFLSPCVLRWYPHIGKSDGLLLAATGRLVVFGALNRFSQWLIENFPSLAMIESLVTRRISAGRC